MLIFWLAIGSWNWFQTGVFNLLSDTPPLLEQLVFWAAMLSGLFVLLWLMAWQHVELNADTQELRVASIHTGYRWRRLNAKDIARIGYFCHSKSLGQIILHGSAGTPALTILEDSFSAIEPSRRLKDIAGFIRAHNPDVEIAAALTISSANQSDRS